MLRFIPCLILALMLSGCILGKMERITEETRDEVKKSNKAIEETKEGQVVGLMVELLPDSRSKDARAAAVTMLKVDEAALVWYIGLADKSSADKAGFTLDVPGRTVNIPNVSMIGDEVATVRQFDGEEVAVDIAPMSPDLHNAYRVASKTVLSLLALKAKKPETLSAAEIADLREKAKRAITIGTAVLGAMELEPMLAEVEKAGRGDLRSTHLLSVKEREDIATKIRGIVNGLSLDGPTTRLAKALVESRLGVAFR